MIDSSVDDNSVPSKPLVFIALLQGLGLLLLHQSIELEFWPHGQPQWLFAFYAITVAVPIMLMLGLTGHKSRTLLWASIYGLILFALGYYVGSQAVPLEHIKYETLLLFFVLTLSVATFKALMYVQHFSSGGPLSYSRLFLLSWRNFLTLGLALLFSMGTWGVLMLWAGLFKAIKIDFFYELFTERWFYYPALALANGFGVVIFRHQSTVIDTITRIQQALMKFLLVILALVSVIFLLALPFAGLAPLWETGGSTLILWMQALMLFFINAVYQDDPESQPYPVWIHRFIYLGVALLPIYSLISFYGLSLRVEQYGWSVARCWAFLLWALFTAFSIGYLWGIVKLKDHWLRQLSWVNVRMGLVVLGLMLLVNSPLLDFRKIATSSQMSRLHGGLIEYHAFDYSYFRSELARPGYEALQRMKDDVRLSHPDIAMKIDSYYVDKDNVDFSSSKTAFINSIVGVGPDTPESLSDQIFTDLSASTWRLRRNQSYQLLEIDLDHDGGLEYLLVEVRQHDVTFTLYHMENQHWQSKLLSRVHGQTGSLEQKRKDILQALESGQYGTSENKWDYFEVGGYLLQVP